MILLLLVAAALSLPTGSAAETRYTLPHLVATFLDRDRIVVDISYALPRAGIAASGGSRDVVQIEQTISAVDSLGESYHTSHSRPTTLPGAGATGIRKNYLLARERIVLPLGRYDVHVGVRDLRVRSTGAFHARSATPGEGGLFDLSDLLLATDISTPDDARPTRWNLTVDANPLRTYRAGERVFVYLEVYNLERDAFGQTRFEIAYRMERPESDEIDAALFEALDRTDVKEADVSPPYLVPNKHRSGHRVEKTWGTRGGQATIATRYVGDSATDFTYLEFDVSQLPDGIHKLTIRATDLHVLSAVERAVLFRVLNE